LTRASKDSFASLSKFMDGCRKNVELSANVAIVVAAVLLCVVLVKNQFAEGSPARPAGPRPASNNVLRLGEKVGLADVDWQKNGQTLLLVLSTTCHYCSESTAFYQQLIKARNSGSRIIAALPQPVNESQDYLKGHGVSVDDVKQVDLDSIGVSGTPTLILVDDDGVVKGLWVGKLPKADEAKVISRLQERIAQR
jgi:hypothetical protein